MIKLNNISIGYTQESPLIQVDSLCMENGLYVLISRNGAGKSTFLNTINGGIQPLKGNITLFNIELNSYNSLELAKLVAIVPSVLPPIEYLTVKEFVALGRSPHTNSFGRLTTKDIEIIEQAMQELDVARFSDKLLSELSDGERQLVGIAQAVSQNTPILLLDEPLSFLDYANRKIILNKLNSLSKSNNKLIIFSCHDFGQLNLISDMNYLLINREGIIKCKSQVSEDEIIQTCFT